MEAVAKIGNQYLVKTKGAQLIITDNSILIKAKDIDLKSELKSPPK